MDIVDITNLSKTDVLVALFNASRPLGLGFTQNHTEHMAISEATELLNQNTYFDYIRGRVMKIDIGGDELNTWAYDRDNGQGAAARAIKDIPLNG